MSFFISKNHKKRILFLTILTLMVLGLFFQNPSPGYADPVNYALEFDGWSNYVATRKEGIIFGSSSWQSTKSISVWVKPLAPSPVCTGPDPGSCQLIVGDRPRFWGIYRGILNGEDRIWVWNFDNSPTSGFDSIPIIYENNEWIHITLVHHDNRLDAYRFGFLAGSRVSGASVGFFDDGPADQTVLHIGGGFTPPDRKFLFKGLIDEVRVYNRPLSGEEIRADIYNELSPPFDSALKAYYKMSDGSGRVLSDDSGNGHNGTLDHINNQNPPGNDPLWVVSGLFGSGPTPTLPATFTVTATFTNTPSPTATRLPPGFTPQPSLTPTRTLDPNMNNFLFLPMVRK
ncbi:concanavalin A-like lectin/glucanases superfamily [Bellilinea caldifistulae]|uniref:LamG domain-containing protein n=1 Tax=Bellilinea caldifistulae TaxID=360411 RepID=UPI000784FA96|nr:LamG domain-containing protein [Bellilinea caldifistulae]GAP11614.1 concanavalin A-like lectin/glucanases superfamily [Bellilinea caldifistulae]